MNTNKQLPKGAVAVSVEVGTLSHDELLDQCCNIFKARRFPEQHNVFKNMPVSQEGKIDFHFVNIPTTSEERKKYISLKSVQDWLKSNDLKFIDPMVLLYYNMARVKSGLNIEFFQYTMWIHSNEFCFLCFQNPNWCFWGRIQKPDHLGLEYWLPVIPV